MTSIMEVEKAIAEGKALQDDVKSTFWKDHITIGIKKLENQLKTLKDLQEADSKPKIKASYTTIRNYSWDQSDNFVKLYISLDKVEELDANNVISTYGTNEFNFTVENLLGKSYELNIILAHEIDPAKSYHKVKSNMVVLFLRKKSSKTWDVVSAEELRTKKAKEIDTKKDKDVDSSDPSAGIMNIMKKMYDEGDDDMKRMLKKTWYESQNKKANEGMPGLGGFPN